MTASRPSDARQRFVDRAGLLVLAALAASFVIQHGESPFALGLERSNAYRILSFSQRWEERGFGESLGLSYFSPFEERLADRQPYVHHPPAPFWHFHASRLVFGRGIAAFRAPGCLCTVLALIALYALVRSEAGTLAAVVAATVFAAMPWVQKHGHQALIEVPVIPAVIGFVALWRWWRLDPGRRRSLWLALAFFAGCLIDWGFWFVAAGTFVADLAVSRSRAARQWILGLAGVAAGAAVLGHAAVALGSVRLAIQDALGAAKDASLGPDAALSWEGELRPSLLASLLDRLADGFDTRSAMLVAAAVLALAIFRDRPARLWIPFALLVQALLMILVFLQRSTTHDYFWMFLAAPCAIVVGFAAGSVVERVRAPRRAAAALVLVALSLALYVAAALDTEARRREQGDADIAAEARAIDEVLPPGSFVLGPPESDLSVGLKSRAHWVQLGDLSQIAHAADACRAGGAFAARRAALALSLEFCRRFPQALEAADRAARQYGLRKVLAGSFVLYMIA